MEEDNTEFFEKLESILESYRDSDKISNNEYEEIYDLCMKYDIKNNKVKSVEKNLLIQQKLNPNWQFSVYENGEIIFSYQWYRDICSYYGKVIDHSHISIYKYEDRDGTYVKDLVFNIDEENIFRDYLPKV